MKANVGGTDRILRIVIGLALIAFAIFSKHEYADWAWIGVIPLATGIIRWCPGYLLVGANTCKPD